MEKEIAVSKRWLTVIHYVPLVLFVLALYLLLLQVKHIDFGDFRSQLAHWHLYSIESAILLTAASFIVLMGYDYLALKLTKKEVPLPIIARTSFIAFSLSNMIGHSWLSGGAVRLREYGKVGVPFNKVSRIALQNTLTFWLGFVFLTGFCLFLFPDGATALGISTKLVHILGGGLLGSYCIFLGICLFYPNKVLRIKQFEFALPDFLSALAATVIAAVDLTLCASIIYVLLPQGHTLSLAHFLAFYLMAQLGGLISQIPGGLGVLDGILLKFLTPYADSHQILISIILFRIIYYFLPFIISTGAIFFQALPALRPMAHRGANVGRRIFHWMLPHILAVWSFVGGLVLILSASTPTLRDRLAHLERWFPIQVLELAHFSSVLIGTGLMLLSRELARRNHSAYRIIMMMLTLGAIFSLMKGFDYEEAIFLALIAGAIFPFRSAFYRKSPFFEGRFLTGYDIAAIFALILTMIVGYFAYSHIPYHDELWLKFSIRADLPRFLRGLVGAGTMVILAIAIRYLRGPSIDETAPTKQNLDQVAKILQNIDDTEAQLALLGDKHVRISEDGQAFLMFNSYGSTWIVLGDIYGPKASTQPLLESFLEEADRFGRRVVFYQVRDQFIGQVLDYGFKVVKLGEEAHIPLTNFSIEGSNRKELRNALRRGEKEGVSFAVWDPTTVAARIDELHAVSDTWLKAKSAREKGFSLGFFSESYLTRFSCAVVMHGDEVVAFANLWLGAFVELSVDLMRYHPTKAPKGTMDFLFVSVLLWGKANGFQTFNLGMAPLAGVEARPWSPLWYRFANLTFKHGEHFYNFKGLREYKEKYHPVWRSRFLVVDPSMSLFRATSEVALLIGGGLRGVLGI